MAQEQRKASARCRLHDKQSSTARRVRQALGLSVALACSGPVAAADAELIAQAFAEQARYLAREAVSYEHGEGVPRDQPYAARLYCESARLGDPEGMYALGWMYANGRGVERNDAYARTLFAMAAMNGSEHAERMLRYTGEYTGDVPEALDPGRSIVWSSDSKWVAFLATTARHLDDQVQVDEALQAEVQRDATAERDERHHERRVEPVPHGQAVHRQRRAQRRAGAGREYRADRQAGRNADGQAG